MKKNLYFIFSLLPFFGFSQTVSVLNITTNDICYSNYNNKLYVTIPSSNGNNGNSIGRINPTTTLLEGTTPFGSEPSVIAISNNGQTLYCGFNGTSTVRKFDVTTNTASIQFPLGNDTSTGAYYAEDIEVMPNNPNTIAIARRNNGYSPKHEGIAIYDNGIIRNTTSQGHTGSNQIEFTDEYSLIGFNNESTEFGFRRLSINAGGVTETSVANSLVWGFGLQFTTYNNKSYFTNGTVIDFNFSPFVAGTFSNANGPNVYDTYNGLVCFASYDYNGTIIFKRFNPENYLLVDSIPINQANGSVKNITVCGNGCYAFNTTDNKVIIINNYPLSNTNFSLKSALTVYPNPISDSIHLSYDDTAVTIEKMEIYTSLGQKVKVVNRNSINANTSIDVSELQSGMYFVELFTNEGNTIRKFIKN